MGHGLALGFADRFIEIWYSNSPMDHREPSMRASPNPKRYDICIIDEELEKQGLVEILENRTRQSLVVKPIRNFRNRCVLSLTIFYLVYFYGDDKNHYMELKKRYRNQLKR